jgi:hypothetical protein
LFPLEVSQPRNRALPLARKLVPFPGLDEAVRNNNKGENRAQCNVRAEVKNIGHGFHQSATGSAILWQRPAYQEQEPDGKNTGQASEIDLVNQRCHWFISPTTSAIDRRLQIFASWLPAIKMFSLGVIEIKSNLRNFLGRRWRIRLVRPGGRLEKERLALFQ